MSIRIASSTELVKWNGLIIANPDGGNILQGREFIEQKAEAGWKPRYVMINDRAVALMEKSIPLLGKVWYAPKGPSTTSTEDLGQLISELIPFAKSQGAFTIKIEPELSHDSDISQLVADYGLIKTRPIQYNYATVLVDLSPSLDDILMSFHQKGRHALRRAERDGVTIEAVEPSDENIDAMYQLLRQTADGAGFAIRPPEYYRDFYRRYGANGQLFLAYFEGQVVAGAFAMVQGQKSMYKDGASVRQRPAYGASHLLQWHVIQWAKSRGSLEHDLAGAPPIASAHDQSHPFYAIGKFKRQFNRQVTEYVGAFEVPVIGWKSKLWQRYIERIVRRLYFKLYKQSWY